MAGRGARYRRNCRCWSRGCAALGFETLLPDAAAGADHRHGPHARRSEVPLRDLLRPARRGAATSSIPASSRWPTASASAASGARGGRDARGARDHPQILAELGVPPARPPAASPSPPAALAPDLFLDRTSETVRAGGFASDSSQDQQTATGRVASGVRAARPASFRPLASARSPKGCDSRRLGWRSRLRSPHPRRQDPPASRRGFPSGNKLMPGRVLDCPGNGAGRRPPPRRPRPPDPVRDLGRRGARGRRRVVGRPGGGDGCPRGRVGLRQVGERAQR